MSSARWKDTVWLKIQMHSLKPRCLTGICVFVKYILWSTYSVLNAACYHGIAYESRLILCPEGRVAAQVLSAAALPQHWSGLLPDECSCMYFLSRWNTSSSVPIPGGDQTRRPPGAFQLLLWSPGSPPSGEWTRVCKAQTWLGDTWLSKSLHIWKN